MNIYLIRHGETQANKEHKYIGITDVSVSGEGLLEIRKKCMKSYYPAYNGQIIYTSGLLRTEQTLKQIYGEVPFFVDERLKESDFGKFENKSYEELKEDTEYRDWISGNSFLKPCPGGESYVMMKQRVMEGFYDIVSRHKAEGRDLILVIHSGPIVAIMESLYTYEKKNYYDWCLENGDFYCIVW